MEQLDALIDKLVTQFVAQVRPVLAIELAKVKERNEKISVLEAANFELRQTIEGFERAHKIKLEKPSLVAPPKIEPKKELDESIEISDDGDDDDDATMVSQVVREKSPILNRSSKSIQPPVLTQNTASKLLFGDENIESSDDEDFNSRPAPQTSKTKTKETKRSLEVNAKLQSTLDTLNEDERFWHETVLSKKRTSDGASKKPSTKRQKTRQTKLTPAKTTTTKKKKTKQLDLAKLQRFARGEIYTQEKEELEREINPPKPIYDYNKRTDPGPKYWINGEMDETQATVYSQ